MPRRSTGQPPLWADADTVSTAAEGWTDAQVMCRDMRHSWAPLSGRRDRDTGTIERVVECPRCGTVRTDVISARTGELLRGTRYTYAEGYLTEGVGRIAGGARDRLRLIAVQKITDDPVIPITSRRRKTG